MRFGRIFLMVLTLCLLLSGLVFTVGAESEAPFAFTCDANGELAVGETFTVTVSLDFDTVKSMILIPVYDGEVLEMISAKWTESVTEQEELVIYQNWKPATPDAVVAFAANVSLDAAVFEMQFRVIAVGETQIGVCSVINAMDAEGNESRVLGSADAAYDSIQEDGAFVKIAAVAEKTPDMPSETTPDTSPETDGTTEDPKQPTLNVVLFATFALVAVVAVVLTVVAIKKRK